jgi:hypothetical protein
MDGTSPGNTPVAFANACGGGVVNGAYGTTACIIEPFHPWPAYQPTCAPSPWAPLPDYHFAPVPAKLSDDDVERIARRVVEILREDQP